MTMTADHATTSANARMPAAIRVANYAAGIERYRFQDHVRDFESRRVLCLEGGPVTHVHWVQSGWLALSKSLQNGRRQIVDFALPGDIVNPGAGIDGTAASQVETATLARVATIPVSLWTQKIRTRADLLQVARRNIYAHNARLGERMLRIGTTSAEVRLSYVLLEFCVRLGDPAIDGSRTYPIPLTHRQIGDFTGLTSVHVCRTLRRLVRQGIIDNSGTAHIRILDLARLGEIANADPSKLRRAISPDP
jgi:CRP/FNR family transcriptional regulator, anaerobic regulatory protein